MNAKTHWEHIYETKMPTQVVGIRNMHDLRCNSFTKLVFN